MNGSTPWRGYVASGNFGHGELPQVTELALVEDTGASVCA